MNPGRFLKLKKVYIIYINNLKVLFSFVFNRFIGFTGCVFDEIHDVLIDWYEFLKFCVKFVLVLIG